MTMQQAPMFTMRLKSAISLVVLLAATTILAAARPGSRQSARSYDQFRNPESKIQNLKSKILLPPLPYPDNSEFLIDTAIAPAPTFGDISSRSVAFDGVNFLVTWLGDDNGVYAARATSSGELLDPFGIVVWQGGQGHNVSPTVAFNGTCYMIVWQAGGDILGTRLLPSGAVLDTNPISLSARMGAKSAPSVASNGSEFVVLWSLADYATAVFFTRVTGEGAVLDPQGVLIVYTYANGVHSSIASDGTDFLAVWEDHYIAQDTFGISAVRISSTGAVLDSNPMVILPLSYGTHSSSVVFDGLDYLVVWQQGTSSAQDIRGGRVSRDGVVLDSSGIIITAGAGTQSYPIASSDGGGALVTWVDRREGDPSVTYGTRMTQTGEVQNPGGARMIPHVYAGPLAICFGPGLHLTVWHGDWGVRATRISPGGAVLDTQGFFVATSPNAESRPAVASNGTEYLAAWHDDRHGALEVLGLRLDGNGAALDSSPILIAQSEFLQEFPVVVAGDSCFFVAWWDRGEQDVKGVRVSFSGAVIDTIPIRISNVFSDIPSLAFNGRDFLVLESVTDSDPPPVAVWRVSQSGVLLDSSGIRVTAAGLGSRAASDGTDFLVVWEDYRTDTATGVYAARVTSSGILLDSNGIAIGTPVEKGAPAVAYDGTNYFVVWVDDRASRANIYGSRVTPAGIVLDPEGIPICPGAAVQTNPAITFDGSDYVVVWQDWRNADIDLYGARVSSTGTVLDSFAVTTQPGIQAWPALSKGQGRQVFMAWDGPAHAAVGHGHDTTRVWGRLYPFSGIAEARTTLNVKPSVLEASPNPFRDRVSFQLAAAGSPQEIRIYDVSGTLVRSLAVPTMLRSATWDGKDARGRRLPGGVYLARLGEKDGVTREVLMLR